MEAMVNLALGTLRQSVMMQMKWETISQQLLVGGLERFI